jgi:hypothetical protein
MEPYLYMMAIWSNMEQYEADKDNINLYGILEEDNQ